MEYEDLKLYELILKAKENDIKATFEIILLFENLINNIHILMEG